MYATSLAELILQFNGRQFPNNSILDSTLIGEDLDGLFCLTNFLNCCRSTESFFNGMARGDWFYGNGTDLRNKPYRIGEFYINRGTSAVRLNRVKSVNEEDM